VEQLKAGGIEAAFALPVSVFKERSDLRLHRKFVVIGETAGKTVSFNLVAHRFFKQGACVGILRFSVPRTIT
jgi:hypothetical protein